MDAILEIGVREGEDLADAAGTGALPGLGGFTDDDCVQVGPVAVPLH